MLKMAAASLLLRGQCLSFTLRSHCLSFTQLLHGSPIVINERQLRLFHNDGGQSRSKSKPPKTKTTEKESSAVDNRDASGKDVSIELEQSAIHSDLLLMTGSRTAERTHALLAKREKTVQFLCKAFDCSYAELEKIEEKHSLLKNLYWHTVESLEEKMKFFQQYSIGAKDFQESPEIFNVRMPLVLSRMPFLQKLREEGKISFEKWPLNTIAARTRTFDLRVKRALENKGEINGMPLTYALPLTYASLARYLGVTEKDVRDVSINMPNILARTVPSKIQYLLSQGLHSHDILNHIYILHQSKRKLERALKKCHDLGFMNPPIHFVLSFLRTGQLPKSFGNVPHQQQYLRKLLGVNPVHFTHMDAIRPVWAADRLTIKRNFDFLISEGFSVDDILSCVTILAHDNNILQEYYHKLWQRPDVKPFAGVDVWKDKKRTVNLLQYVLEKDMDFSSRAFNVFIELGIDPHAEEK